MNPLILSPDHTLTNRSEEHTSELQSRQYLVCRLLLEKKKNQPPQLCPHHTLSSQPSVPFSYHSSSSVSFPLISSLILLIYSSSLLFVLTCTPLFFLSL